MEKMKNCVVSGSVDLPSVDALADYTSLMSLENYNKLGNQVNFAGASSSTDCNTRMYVNRFDHNSDQPPTPRAQRHQTAYPSNLLGRIGATNSTNYHPFNTSSHHAYNRVALYPHGSNGPPFLGSHDQVPGFDVEFSSQRNTIPNIGQFNTRLTYLNEARAMNGPTPIEYLYDIWRRVSFISQDPSLLFQLACSENGSKRLEMLIKELGSCEFISFLNLTEALATKFLGLAFNSLGRRVILQCFKDLGIRDKRVLSCKVVQYCLTMAMDKSGCILLNDCVLYMEETYKDQVLYIIQENSHLLAQHRYGTYVVQNAVSMDYKNFTPSIVENLKYTIPALSIQKEGSHLVEKCIDCFSARRTVVEVFLKLSSHGLRLVACDKFGNFVVQKALSSTLEQPEFLGLHWRLQRSLSPLVEDLRRHKFGKNVASKLVYGLMENVDQ